MALLSLSLTLLVTLLTWCAVCGVLRDGAPVGDDGHGLGERDAVHVVAGAGEVLAVHPPSHSSDAALVTPWVGRLGGGANAVRVALTRPSSA